MGYSYNIGKYEVTAGQYCEFLNAVAREETYGLYNTYMSDTSWGSGISRSGGGTLGNPYTYAVASDFINRPVNFVSWGDAARFANWLHNGQPTGAQNASTTEDGAYDLCGTHAYYDAQGGVANWYALNTALTTVMRKPNATWGIPTEDEWYKAAYYKGGSTNAGYFDYPTSSDTVPGRDMADASGNNANFYIDGSPPIDPDKRTTVVGEFQNSDSPYGTFDQGGNVREWTEAVWFDEGRGQRGGSCKDAEWDMRASIWMLDYPILETSYTGFRVVQVPEPCSAVLLLASSLLLIQHRRQKTWPVHGQPLRRTGPPPCCSWLSAGWR